MKAQDQITPEIAELPDHDTSPQKHDSELITILQEITFIAKLGHLCFLYRTTLRKAHWKRQEPKSNP